MIDTTEKISGVFPAYYKNCRAINSKLIHFFKSCGFDFLNERHYFGTEYFGCIFPLYIIILPIFLLMCYLDLKIMAAYSYFVLKNHSYALENEFKYLIMIL